MKNFMQLAWVDICKLGSYLVTNTPSAAANLTEQLKKYSTTSPIIATLSERIFGAYSGTAGLHAHQLHKLKLLLDSVHAKTQNEEAALKDYAFALRNMLMHSDYKSVIKYLEKPSTTPQHITEYLDEIAKFHPEEALDSYTKIKYLFLYSFIKNIMETNRMISRVSLATQEDGAGAEIDRYFQFLSQNNELSKQLQQQMILPLNKDAVDADALADYFGVFHIDNLPPTISAVALLQQLNIYIAFDNTDELLAANHYFRNKYRPFEEQFHLLGLNVHEVLQYVHYTAADLYRVIQQAQHDKIEKRKKQLVGALLHAALIHYLDATTARLNAIFQQESTSKVAVQKTPKPANDAALKKELFDLKNKMKQMEAEQAALQRQLKAAQQQQYGLQQKLAAAQLENTRLHEQLGAAPKEFSLSANAQELVREIAFLTKELTAELQLDEPVVEQDVETLEEELHESLPENYIEKIKQLKLAVIGGHDKYHTNIKNTFKQDVFTLSPDRLNSDVSKLLNYDVLVFITSYNNHNLYNRSYDYVKKNGAKERCLILNTQPSPKRLAQQIYEFVAQKEFVH